MGVRGLLEELGGDGVEVVSSQLSVLSGRPLEIQGLSTPPRQKLCGSGRDDDFLLTTENGELVFEGLAALDFAFGGAFVLDGVAGGVVELLGGAEGPVGLAEEFAG
jgi:hypothetical protein